MTTTTHPTVKPTMSPTSPLPDAAELAGELGEATFTSGCAVQIQDGQPLVSGIHCGVAPSLQRQGDDAGHAVFVVLVKDVRPSAEDVGTSAIDDVGKAAIFVLAHAQAIHPWDPCRKYSTLSAAQSHRACEQGTAVVELGGIRVATVVGARVSGALVTLMQKHVAQLLESILRITISPALQRHLGTSHSADDKETNASPMIATSAVIASCEEGRYEISGATHQQNSLNPSECN